jgi:hypothetical protein
MMEVIKKFHDLPPPYVAPPPELELTEEDYADEGVEIVDQFDVEPGNDFDQANEDRPRYMISSDAWNWAWDQAVVKDGLQPLKDFFVLYDTKRRQRIALAEKLHIKRPSRKWRSSSASAPFTGAAVNGVKDIYRSNLDSLATSSMDDQRPQTARKDEIAAAAAEEEEVKRLALGLSDRRKVRKMRSMAEVEAELAKIDEHLSKIHAAQSFGQALESVPGVDRNLLGVEVAVSLVNGKLVVAVATEENPEDEDDDIVRELGKEMAEEKLSTSDQGAAAPPALDTAATASPRASPRGSPRGSPRSPSLRVATPEAEAGPPKLGRQSPGSPRGAASPRVDPASSSQHERTRSQSLAVVQPMSAMISTPVVGVFSPAEVRERLGSKEAEVRPVEGRGEDIKGKKKKDEG